MSQGMVNSPGITFPVAVSLGGTGVTTSTGSGANVLGTAPTIAQPNLVGIIDGSSAATGSIGETLSSVILVGSAVSLVNATAANVTLLSVTPGKWVLGAEVWLSCGGTTVGSLQTCAINTTSATLPGVPGLGIGTTRNIASWTAGTNGTPVTNINGVEINISSTTTYYLIVNLTFSTSTAAAYGKLVARRVM